MCGIAGIMRFDGAAVDPQQITRMTDLLAHRGPDGHGLYLSKNKQVGLGHRRLSILDLDERSAQPFRFEQLHLTYNGEIYNYVEVRQELEKLQYTFSTSGDTEVLLKAYHAWGRDFLQRLDGMFAFLICDENSGNCFAACDRFGEKPFYYTSDKEKFAFASEVKALGSLQKLHINQSAIYRYLIYDITGNPDDQSETFFRDVHQLEPSHWMEITSDGSINKQQYWSASEKSTFQGSEADAIAEFNRLFNLGIERRLRSDVSVGSSLSGGLDSSAIVASILSEHRDEMETFTARFDHADFDEGSYVDVLQKKYAFSRNETWPKAREWLDELDKVFYHQEEIFGGSSIYAQWKVMELAKEKNTSVLLDGQGGDEVLAGYHKYFLSFLSGQFRKNPFRAMDMKKRLQKELGLSYGSAETLQMMAPAVFDLLRNSSLTGGRRSEMEKYLGTDILSEVDKQNNPFHSYSRLNPHLHFDCFQYGLNKLLRFADRNSMAFSRELRLPFLFHELVEFAFSLPDELKMKVPWTKYILRKSMEDKLPEEVLWRKDKKGFAPPQANWLQDPIVQKRVQKAEKELMERNYILPGHRFDPWQVIMVDQLISFTESDFNGKA